MHSRRIQVGYMLGWVEGTGGVLVEGVQVEGVEGEGVEELEV